MARKLSQRELIAGTATALGAAAVAKATAIGAHGGAATSTIVPADPTKLQVSRCRRATAT